MAKTSTIEREKKRAKLAARYRNKVLDVKEKLRQLYVEGENPNANFDVVYQQVEELQEKLQRLPRNAHVIRGRHNRNIHTANSVNFVIIDFWENDLFSHP